MELYDQVIEKLKDMVGKGRFFETQKDLALHAGVQDSLLSNHFKKKRGESFRPIFNVLDKVGVKIVFPGEKIKEEKNKTEKEKYVIELEEKNSTQKDEIIDLLKYKISTLKNSDNERFWEEINQYIYALARVSEGQGRSLLSIASTPWKDLHRLTPGEKDLLWKIARVILLEHPERKSTRHHIGMDRGHPHHIPHNKAEERTSCLDIYEKMARDIRIERQEDEEEERK